MKLEKTKGPRFAGLGASEDAGSTMLGDGAWMLCT